MDPSETLPKLPHIFVELEPVQNEKIHGRAIEPIHLSFVSNHHLHLGCGYEVQDPIFRHLHGQTAVKEDDPVPKPLPHDSSEGLKVDSKVGEMDTSRVPVEGQVKDSESLHMFGDLEVEFELVDGTTSEKDRPCAVRLSEELQEGSYTQSIFNVIGPKRFQTNHVLDGSFSYHHRNHLNRSGIIKALGPQGF